MASHQNQVQIWLSQNHSFLTHHICLEIKHCLQGFLHELDRTKLLTSPMLLVSVVMILISNSICETPLSSSHVCVCVPFWGLGLYLLRRLLHQRQQWMSQRSWMRCGNEVGWDTVVWECGGGHDVAVSARMGPVTVIVGNEGRTR
jgi:hypothetical protein